VEIIKALYQITTGTEAEFAARDYTYPLGVATYITSGANAKRMKIADGVNRWTLLPFFPPLASQTEPGLIKSASARLFVKINQNGTAEINGLAAELDDINATDAAQDAQILDIQTQLAGMKGTIIYIGVVEKYTGELKAMDDETRNALLTARALDIRGRVMDGYTLQDLGMADEPGRFNYWQYQDDGAWFDLGERGDVSQATDEDFGIVIGSGAVYKIHIEADGAMSVNGLQSKLNELDDADGAQDAQIETVNANLADFETRQAETNAEFTDDIARIESAAQTQTDNFNQFKTEQTENNEEQETAIETAQASANTAQAAAATAQAAAAWASQASVKKAIFADTNGALVADAAIEPGDGVLANIGKTLKNAETGENFKINVQLTSEGETLASEFTEIDEHNYRLNLEAEKLKTQENSGARFFMGNTPSGGHISGETFYDGGLAHLWTRCAVQTAWKYPRRYCETFAYVCADIEERDALSSPVIEYALCIDGGEDGADALYKYNAAAAVWDFIENRPGQDEDDVRVLRYVEELRPDGRYFSTAITGYNWQKAAEGGGGGQTWLPSVQKKADLPALSTLSPSAEYLCDVINDAETPANNAVWLLAAGAVAWTYFSARADAADLAEIAELQQIPTSLQTTDPPAYVVARIDVADGGAGYAEGDALTLSEPPVAATVSGVDAAGAVTALAFDGSTVYSEDPSGSEIAADGGSGSGAICSIRTAYAPGDVQKDGELQYTPYTDPLVQTSRMRGYTRDFLGASDMARDVVKLNAMREWSQNYLYKDGDATYFKGQWFSPNPASPPIFGESPETHPEKWIGTAGVDDALQSTVMKIGSKLDELWREIFGQGAAFTNHFALDFFTLSGVNLEAGVWNTALGRVEV
jgi:hypothetical protein